MPTALSKFATGLKYSSILAKVAVMQNWNEAASRRYLLDSLGSMPGVSAKAAQFLAMKLGEGQDQNPVRLEPMPISWVKAWIEQHAPRLHAELLEISEHPIVASLGQVHEARLRSGEAIAIKIQFPNLKKSFDEQIGLLRQVSRAGPPKKFRFEMQAILDYFSQSLLREIDYRIEAAQQMEAQRQLPKGQAIVIARVYPEYSCETVLVQSYEPSSSLAKIKQWWPDDARFECAGILVDYFLHGIFQAQHIHTDPHPGNLGFRNRTPDGSGRNYELVLYDFGSTMKLEKSQSSALWTMIHAYQNQKDVVPFDQLVALGFDPQKLLPLSQRLPCLMERLFEPFCQDAAFDFRRWDLKAHFEAVLGEDRWWFRSAGPPWFLMMMRAAQGVVHALCELNTNVQVKSRLKALDLPVPTAMAEPVLAILQGTHGSNTAAMAKKLFVAVDERGGGSVVRMELPCRAIDDLEDLIPEETLARMKDQQIDFAAIKQRVQTSGYAPQALFEAETETRRYRVWLQ